MRGLDPRIHDEVRRRRPYHLQMWQLFMDCRVNGSPAAQARLGARPGNDSGEIVPDMTAERVGAAANSP
jgi:hypothetical protein